MGRRRATDAEQRERLVERLAKTIVGPDGQLEGNFRCTQRLLRVAGGESLELAPSRASRRVVGQKHWPEERAPRASGTRQPNKAISTYAVIFGVFGRAGG